MLKRGQKTMETTTPVVGRRVNFVLSENAHTDLVSLSKNSMRSMTELVRLGLGLVKVALEAQQNGNKLIVTTADGQPLKEIVLPS
jgi:hypothetical protein